MHSEQFNIGDPVNVFAAECMGKTNGAILNVRTDSRERKQYLVATRFYIQWMCLSPENVFDPSKLATQVMPVDLPHPCSVRCEDLPPEHPIQELGTWKYIGPLTLHNPPIHF